MTEPIHDDDGLALRVRGVSKAFDAPVLDDLDLDVPVGSLVALLGPSGCGKTTLLRLVAGFECADAGTVEVGGRLVEGRDASGRGRHVAPERRRVGIVPQEGALFPHLSVHDNVAFGLPRAARRGTSPTKNMRLESPYQPSRISVTSMLRMSPSRNCLSFGMPWHTT